MNTEKTKKEEVGIVETIEVIVNKKRGNASFEIKHDVNGKETMAMTCKDENGKEMKIEIPWEKVQQIRK
jgi:sporulation protein YlmC with PRC-barrel domain